MSKIVLECNNLCKAYVDGATKTEILRNINLSVGSAETIAIVGSSGSGKSTLLHLLGGLDKPTSGEVFLAGKKLTGMAEGEKCRLRNQSLGFVYQFHHLLPEFTALENVCIALLIRGLAPKVAKEKSAHFLELVGLGERMQHKIGELSGGERQRVAISRALVTDPLCVLADEPTGNLDPGNAQKVFDLFLELQQKQKMSVVMVTHDATLAEAAGRRYIIENGSLD